MSESSLRDELLSMSKAHIEDGVRIGIGMCVRVIDVSIENMGGQASQAQLDALAGVRDAMREMSAEFTLDDTAAES